MVRVLVLDDGEVQLASVKDYLAVAGDYDVWTATSTTAAAEALRLQKFDVLMVDFSLKEEANGLDFLLAARAAGVAAPAILMSAVMQERILEVLESGKYSNVGRVEVLQKASTPPATLAGTIQRLVKEGQR